MSLLTGTVVAAAAAAAGGRGRQAGGRAAGGQEVDKDRRRGQASLEVEPAGHGCSSWERLELQGSKPWQEAPEPAHLRAHTHTHLAAESEAAYLELCGNQPSGGG